MWYDLLPSEYAGYLNFCADRREEQINRYLETLRGAKKSVTMPSWTYADATQAQWSMRGLRAHAWLLSISDAARAGDVDVLGLSDPTMPTALEQALIEAIEDGAPMEALKLLGHSCNRVDPELQSVILEVTGGSRAGERIWCQIRSLPDMDGSTLVYAPEQYWLGRYSPELQKLREDDYTPPLDVQVIWRGHVPFSMPTPQALSWIDRAIEEKCEAAPTA